jgi:hypothetical protein
MSSMLDSMISSTRGTRLNSLIAFIIVLFFALEYYMKSFPETIAELFYKLPPQERMLYKVNITEKYGSGSQTLNYDDISPRVQVVIMSKDKVLEGVYPSVDYLERAIQEYNLQNKMNIFLSGNEIRIGRGFVKTIGYFRIL